MSDIVRKAVHIRNKNTFYTYKSHMRQYFYYLDFAFDETEAQSLTCPNSHKE